MSLTLLATTVLPALVPALADGLKSVVNRFTGGAQVQPQTVEERTALNESEAKRITALAALDRPSGNVSQWVADLRASFRYIAAGAILLNAFTSPMWAEPDQIALSWEAGRSAFSFIFGDRMYNYVKRR